MKKSIFPFFWMLVGAPALYCCASASVDTSQLKLIHSVYLGPINTPTIKLVPSYDPAPPDTNISLNDLLVREGLHFGAETFAALSGAFRRSGYLIATSPREADAITQVTIRQPDYVANPPVLGNDCEPIVLFDVRMTNAKTGATILDHTYRFQSGGGTGMTGHILLDAGSAYNLDSCAALWTTPSVPVSAFRAAAGELAHAVGTEVTAR